MALPFYKGVFMSLEKNESLALSERVLKHLNTLIEKSGRKRKIEKSFYVEQYNNGREQGYCIRHYETRINICFSQYRTNDNVVVYSGHDFDNINGNIPSDLAFEECKFFDTPRQASKHLFEKLMLIIG